MYKVIKWRFDKNQAESLEKVLNEYANEGWEIDHIISSPNNSTQNDVWGEDCMAATIIMKKHK